MDKDINVTATAVRVLSLEVTLKVNIEFESEFDVGEVKNSWMKMPGLKVVDDPLQCKYPMPINVADKNEVFVGRIRRDESQEKSLNLWIVADNLRKGAATNAVQIALHVSKFI